MHYHNFLALLAIVMTSIGAVPLPHVPASASKLFLKRVTSLSPVMLKFIDGKAQNEKKVLVRKSANRWLFGGGMSLVPPVTMMGVSFFGGDRLVDGTPSGGARDDLGAGLTIVALLAYTTAFAIPAVISSCVTLPVGAVALARGGYLHYKAGKMSYVDCEKYRDELLAEIVKLKSGQLSREEFAYINELEKKLNS